MPASRSVAPASFPAQSRMPSKMSAVREPVLDLLLEIPEDVVGVGTATSGRAEWVLPAVTSGRVTERTAYW